MTRITTTIAWAVVLMCGVSAAAFVPSRQQPAAASPQTPLFRADIDVVQVDVSVLDKKSRKPVPGLTADDFTVLEDGKLQKIVACDAIDLREAVAPQGATWTRDVTPDVATNNFDERRLFVLVMDDAMMLLDPPSIDSAKHIAHEVIAKLGAQDLMAVVFTRDNRHAQDFTSDRALLDAAVETFTGGTVFLARSSLPARPGMGPRLPGRGGLTDTNPDAYFFESSVNTLSRAADYLGSIPHRRKALVYISFGVPIDIELTTPTLISGTGRGFMNGGITLQLYAELQEAFRRAQRSNVNIYAFDPGGPQGFENLVQRLLLTKGVRAMEAIARATDEANLTRDFLLAAADRPGGRAIVGMTDMDAGIQSLFDENSSHYLIGFSSSNTQHDGGYRRLEVKVNQPGKYDIRARNSYYAPGPDNAKTAAAAADPSKPLAGLLPDPGVALRVSALPFASSTGREFDVAIVLGVHQPAPDTRTAEQIDLVARAFTIEGDPRGSESQAATLVLRPGTSPDAMADYELLTHLPLAKPGRYQLRLSAHNLTLDKAGSVYADIEIPDFAKAPLSVSGVAVTASPSPMVAPKDALASILPIVPTSQREFAVYEHAATFFRLYEGGKTPLAPVTLTTRITDDHDVVGVNETHAIDANRFGAGRAADIWYTIPLATLTPGPHLLTFEATLGKTTVRRDVTFAVK